MAVLKTVDLSIFLFVVDNIRFNSLIKLLNWSLRFFSLKFLDFLMIIVFITRGQWIVNIHWSRNIGNTYLLVSSLSVSSSSYLSLLKQEKNIQVTINNKLHLPNTYKIQSLHTLVVVTLVKQPMQSINLHNNYVTRKKHYVCFWHITTRLPINFSYVVLLISTTQIDLLGFSSRGTTQVVWHSDVQSGTYITGLLLLTSRHHGT